MSSAALLIDQYRFRHQGSLLSWQARILAWHAGQMYGFHGDYERDGDILSLNYHRNNIAAGPRFEGKVMNLDVVDWLLNCVSAHLKSKS